MQRVLIVCGAGASSTFLARRLADLARGAGYAWSVEPAPVDAVKGESVDLVAVTSHVATPTVLEAFASRGIRYLVLPESVRGGFGADAALDAIAVFFGEDESTSDSITESMEMKETR
jgi:PTS system cellobiose-specific IIB component